jgi:hypothetical protein
VSLIQISWACTQIHHHNPRTEETGVKQLVLSNLFSSCAKRITWNQFCSVCAPYYVTCYCSTLCSFIILCCRFAPVQVCNALQLLVVVGILKLKVSCGTATLLQSDRSRVSKCRRLQQPEVGLFVVTYSVYRTRHWFRLVREPCHHTNSVSGVCSARV